MPSRYRRPGHKTRAWLAIVLVMAAAAWAQLSGPVAGAAQPAVLAQQQDEKPKEQEAQGEEEESGGAKEETGGRGEAEEAEPEAGPLWTYQMARLALLGLFPLIAFMAYVYYRLVVQRARGHS